MRSDKNADIAKIVEGVMRKAESGRSPEDIAQSLNADVKLVRQICQIYYTHKGIDVQGILDRL